MNLFPEDWKSRFRGISKVALIANGAVYDDSLIAQLINRHDRVVAVDGGLNHCLQMNITPDLLIGDFDSVTQELLEQYSNIPKLQFPTEKDDTDLDLAIQAIEEFNIDVISLFGSMGKRVDHSISNLYLLSLYDNIVIETEYESIFIIKHKKTIECEIGQKISLFSLGSPAVNVNTHGLQWELTNATINKDFKSISNACLKKSVEITIDSGEIICCLARS